LARWLWNFGQSRVPRLSYRLVAVPYPFAGSAPCHRDELEDGECFIVRNETYGKHALSFYRRLIAPCKIEDALRLKMEIEGDTITITESYAYMPICEVRPYEIEGEIEPLRDGNYTVILANQTDVLYRVNVNLRYYPEGPA